MKTILTGGLGMNGLNTMIVGNHNLDTCGQSTINKNGGIAVKKIGLALLVLLLVPLSGCVFVERNYGPPHGYYGQYRYGYYRHYPYGRYRDHDFDDD